jgi:cytoskeletal protein CcmA (bactofilin family)
MLRNRSFKLLTSLALLALLTMTVVTPALAFEGRSGERITIPADQVIDDDLYVSASEFTLDGTVKGDLFVVGQTITINGTVEGDLVAAAQTIIINGTVANSARLGCSILYVGEKASIGNDLLAGAYSLEARPGSKVGRDVIYGGGQALLAGDVLRNVKAGTGGLQLSGTVGGDVTAKVGDPSEQAGPPPTMFMPQTQVSIPVPTLPYGLTVDPSAKIGGNLDYTSTKQMNIPASVVAGQIQHLVPKVEQPKRVPTPAEKIGKWFLDLLRAVVTLVAIGLLLGWLFPKFVSTASQMLREKPWPSLGWGVVTYAAFFFSLLVLILAMILAGVVFGFLTLGGLSGTVIWLGILTLFALIVGFVLVTSFVTKIIIGLWGGKWILGRFNPDLAEHRVWPLVLGVAIVAILVALPFLGWLINLLVVLFGLGALWLIGRQALVKQPGT